MREWHISIAYCHPPVKRGGDNIWADHTFWNNPGIREEIKKVQLSAVEKRVYSLLEYGQGNKNERRGCSPRNNKCSSRRIYDSFN